MEKEPMSELTVASTEGVGAAYDMALEDIDVSNPELFRDNTWPAYFKRLREEDPVHYCRNSMFGPYWSMTKFATSWPWIRTRIFSSEAPAASRSGRQTQRRACRCSSRWTRRSTMFSATPSAPSWRRANLAKIESTIRERAARLLDSLPRNETFNWVDTRLDRTDHADARDLVRFSVRRPPQADALVRRRHTAARVAGSSIPKKNAAPN